MLIMQQLTIKRPDDWHLHLRDGDMLSAVLPQTSQHFSRAVIMPNLVPPVVTLADAQQYRERIQRANKDARFTPLMTLYLTEQTVAADVVNAAKSGTVVAVKLYPAGATTNSASGVTSIDAVMPVLEAMAENHIVLCLHGEVTHSDVDIFDREKTFLDTVLAPLKQRLPELKIVLEHVTTAEGVSFVQSYEKNVAGTLTPHHLLLNRNHMLVGGIRPHYYCLPILKREAHRKALVQAATSGDKRFFLGTDSAPHTVGTKENACGCAGVFNAPNTLSTLALVFERENALENLEAFVSLNGPAHYGLPVNEDEISLIKKAEPVSHVPYVHLADEKVAVFDPGEPLYWHVE